MNTRQHRVRSGHANPTTILRVVKCLPPPGFDCPPSLPWASLSSCSRAFNLVIDSPSQPLARLTIMKTPDLQRARLTILEMLPLLLTIPSLSEYGEYLPLPGSNPLYSFVRDVQLCSNNRSQFRVELLVLDTCHVIWTIAIDSVVVACIMQTIPPMSFPEYVLRHARCEVES